MQRTFAQEQIFPSCSSFPEDQDLVLYHRTGGGKDVDPKAAKKSILKTQRMQILNRDEARADPGGPTNNNNFIWMSNRLNDSVFRTAFGEDACRR